MEYIIIYRNLWYLVSLANFMTFTMFWFFHKHTASKYSVDVNGFGISLEMGKKC